MRLREFERTNYEVRNYHKLDKYLAELCDLVEKGQASGKDFGMVAAGILPLKGDYMARLNRPGENGRIHAEHAVIEDFVKKYGSIPEGSVIITTLSPCNKPMDERDGPSCADLLNEHGIQKVYCGYIDPTQHDGAEDNREYNLVETQNKELRTRCEEFADTFLDKVHENFADGKNPGRKEIDPDVYEDLSNSIIARTARQIVPTIRAKSTPEGYVYLSTQDGLSLVIGCNIAGGSIDINIGSQPMETTSSGPHKGAVTKIIEAVYQAAAKQYGAPIKQGTLSIDHDAGHGVWQHIAQKLGLQHDAYMVKENFADGKHPEDKGDSARLGIPKHASISSLRKIAHQGGRKGQLAHWQANMRSGRHK
jgi:pyrimidine deaminase RibD-like protein